MEDLRRRLDADSSDVGMLLRALFLPQLYANNLRFASEGAGVTSACSNLSQNYDVSADWIAASQAQQIPATDMMAYLFANPLRSFVYFVHNAAGAPYSYNALNDNGTLLFPADAIGVTIQTYFLGAQSALPFSPHGFSLAAGHDDAGNNYLWVDQSPLAGSTATMRVTFTVAPGANSTQISWWVWNGKSAVFWAKTNTLPAQASYDCPIPPPAGGAYMFVRVTNTTDLTLTTFTVNVIGNRGCWAHRPVPNIEELTGPDLEFLVSGIRVNAAAFRAQNSSQEIGKNGNLVSVTVSSCIPWTSTAVSASYLSSLEGYRERSNENGYYGVLLPDSDEDISDFFDDILPSADGSGPQVTYPLSERRPYKALGITAPNPDGRNWLFEVTHAIEYLTNWKIQTRDNPRTSEESLKAAIIIASTMETDYENPSHWTDIVNTIGKYGERFVGLQLEGPGAAVLDAISNYHPAAKIARVIGKNVVLPAQKMLFQEMQEYGNSKKARKSGGYMRPSGGGQFKYVDM